MRVFLARIFLVIGSPLSSGWTYNAISFWVVEFLLRNQLITLYEFPCILYVVLPLLLLLFYICLFVSLITMCQLVKNPPAMQETPVQFLSQKNCWRRHRLPLQYSWASLVAQLVKNPAAMLGTWAQCLSWEDPLEKEKSTQFSVLALRIPWTA